MSRVADAGGDGYAVDGSGMVNASASLDDLSQRPKAALAPVAAAKLGAPAAGVGIESATGAMTSALTTVLGEIAGEYLVLGSKVSTTATIYRKADQTSSSTFSQFPGLARFGP